MDASRFAVLVAYDRAIDEKMGDLLEELGLAYYTKWKDVTGVGRHDPHLGDPVWPGLNNALLVVAGGPDKDRLLQKIGDLQDSFAAAGLRAFVLPVLEEV
jgi:hypothetical protein